MKKLLATLSVAALSLLAFNSALAQSHGLSRPDCSQPDRDTYVLKFYGESITSGHQARRLPLKRLLKENCRISHYELGNIARVAVKAQSYSRHTAVWLEGDRFRSHAEYLYNTGRKERASFNLRKGDSSGRVGVFLYGDLDLYKIRVSVEDSYRPGPRPAPRPSPRPAPGQPRRERTYDVTCSSKDSKYAFCSAPGLIRGHLVQRHSESKCREGSSFRFTNQGVHVDNGCRATFRVTVRR